MKVVVTGGCGFIGSALVRWLLQHTKCHVLNVDALSYAAQPESVATEGGNERYSFLHADIRDRSALRKMLRRFRPQYVFHLAAETHVDRSISESAVFVETNLIGTFCLLEVLREWLPELDEKERAGFRYIQVSTDEVYGDQGKNGPAAAETAAWRTASPYAATKAGADHLADAWHRTWGLPVITSHCTNNYGPWQYPEKLIPLVIRHALAGERIPVYGAGEQVRDWIHVEDHVRALWLLAHDGIPGEHYNVAGRCPRRNIALIHDICQVLDRLFPQSAPSGGHASLVEHVLDRPGHDWRYAVDDSKIRALGWRPEVDFEAGLEATVRFYIAHQMA